MDPIAVDVPKTPTQAKPATPAKAPFPPAAAPATESKPTTVTGKIAEAFGLRKNGKILAAAGASLLVGYAAVKYFAPKPTPEASQPLVAEAKPEEKPKAEEQKRPVTEKPVEEPGAGGFVIPPTAPSASVTLPALPTAPTAPPSVTIVPPAYPEIAPASLKPAAPEITPAGAIELPKTPSGAPVAPPPLPELPKTPTAVPPIEVPKTTVPPIEVPKTTVPPIELPKSAPAIEVPKTTLPTIEVPKTPSAPAIEPPVSITPPASIAPAITPPASIAPASTPPASIAPAITPPASIAPAITPSEPSKPLTIEYTKPATLTAPDRAASTTFDVDLHEPTRTDTYGTISKEYYNDAKYAAALAEYNGRRPLQGGVRVEVPPIHVLKKRYPQLVGAVAPVSGFVPPAASPVVKPADPWVTSGPKSYTVPAGGMRMGEVAREALGSPMRWADIYELNPQFAPGDLIPAGTVLKLPGELKNK